MKAKDLYAEYTRGIAMEAFSSSGIKSHSEGVLALIEKSIAVGRAEGYAQGLEDAAEVCDEITRALLEE